jgi:hypothetical protein
MYQVTWEQIGFGSCFHDQAYLSSQEVIIPHYWTRLLCVLLNAHELWFFEAGWGKDVLDNGFSSSLIIFSYCPVSPHMHVPVSAILNMGNPSPSISFLFTLCPENSRSLGLSNSQLARLNSRSLLAPLRFSFPAPWPGNSEGRKLGQSWGLPGLLLDF